MSKLCIDFFILFYGIALLSLVGGPLAGQANICVLNKIWNRGENCLGVVCDWTPNTGAIYCGRPGAMILVLFIFVLLCASWLHSVFVCVWSDLVSWSPCCEKVDVDCLATGILTFVVWKRICFYSLSMEGYILCLQLFLRIYFFWRLHFWEFLFNRSDI